MVLSHEDNLLLTRTGPDTPMGRFFRRYWHAVCLASEVPTPDCAPIDVTLMNEEFVVFRDTEGRVGVLNARCPHRGTALSLGRNEEGGLRCINHGWKFDITGKCVGMLGEPEDSPLRRKACVKAYPVEEHAGIVWAYLGPSELKPAFPGFVWTQLPAEYVFVSKWLQEANYYNAVDGITDSHIAILHSYADPNITAAARTERLAKLLSGDRRTSVFAADTPAGIMVATRRNADEANYFWRISQLYFPYFANTAATGHSFFFVPIDDESNWNYAVSWRLDRPFNEQERFQMGTFGAHVRNTIPGTFIPRANRSNRWLQDRAKQRGHNFSGIDQIPLQDAAVQGMLRAAIDGTTIPDRTQEMLGPNDVGTIKTRQRYLGALAAFLRGETPPGTDRPEEYLRGSGQVVLPKDTVWTEWALENLAPEKQLTQIGSPWTHQVLA